MANNMTLSNTAVSAAADAVVDLLDAGYIRIYDGSQPATPDVAITTQVLLAELRFGTPAFGDAANGVATANAITAEDSAPATGTATWFRVLTSGAAAIFDGTVGTSGCDINLNSVAIQAGAEVTLTEFTYTQPKT